MFLIFGRNIREGYMFLIKSFLMKKVYAFTGHTTPLQMLLSNQIDILELLLAHRPDTTNQVHTFESLKGIIINLKVWFGVFGLQHRDEYRQIFFLQATRPSFKKSKQIGQ